MTDLRPELMRRIDMIGTAINDLRNAVQGRGVDPISTDTKLVRDVNNAQEHWQDVRASLLENSAAQMVAHPFESSGTLEKWETLVNGLIDRAAAHGQFDPSRKLEVQHTTSPGEVLDTVEHALEGTGTFLRDMGLIVVAIGGVYLLSRLLPRGGA